MVLGRVLIVPAKKVTSKDVAIRAGVSRTTVSLVLNNVPGGQISEGTRQKVIHAASELGYVPDAAAQALARRRTQNIGLVLSRSPQHIASDAFLNQILETLVGVTRQNDMRLLLDIVETQHQRQAYLELVKPRRIDGILFSGPCYDDEALHALEEEGFPTVLMGHLPKTKLYSVDIDNRAAAFAAVSHLVRLGHERIACITNAPLSFEAAAERLHGYRLALQASGLAYQDRLVRFGDFDLKSGYLQMSSLLEGSPRPSAVFVASDVVAFGAMAAIRERGLAIPGDIAVVGFDDVPMACYIDPPLTTIQVPAAELARRACQVLLQLIQGEQPPQREVRLGASLVVRGSCGA